MTSYTNYLDKIQDYYKEHYNSDIIGIRNKLMNVLILEEEVKSIMMLVGSDALSDEQKNVLDVAALIRNGFLQQNAYNAVDKYVPVDKQILMLDVIDKYNILSEQALNDGISYKKIYNSDLLNEISQMKYNVENDKLEKLNQLSSKIENYFANLRG